MPDRPGFFCCVCPDSGLLRDGIAAIIALVSDKNPDFRKQVFWGDEELPPRFWEALTLQGFEPTLRIVVLRNAQNLPAENFRRLSRTLGKPNPQSFCLLCLEGAWEKGRPKLPAHLEKLPCILFAQKKGWWKEIPPLDSRSLRAYVTKKASAQGIGFAPGALEAICDMLPPDASAVESELGRLALYAAGRSHNSPPVIIAEDANVLNHVPDFSIFRLIGMMQAGKSTDVWKSIADEAPDELLFPLLGLLQRESRILWQLLAGETPSMNPRDIPARRELARRIGASGLGRLWDSMLDAELAVKTGKKSPEQALSALLAEVTLLFRPATDNESPQARP